MDLKAKELAGIAAAIVAHCQKCFIYHYYEAKRLGVKKNDIKEVMKIARSIRSAGDESMDEFVNRIIKKDYNEKLAVANKNLTQSKQSRLARKVSESSRSAGT